MIIALIFTNDWELFGDGSGDFYDIQYNPLMQMLKIINNYNAKITLMAEIGQQWKHIEFSDKYEHLRNISESWFESILSVIKTGNDVQLHIHPQWINAKFVNNQWDLDKNWSLSKLSESHIYEILLRGKTYLESIIQTLNNEYHCIAFRAGAYYIEPSNIIIECLKKTGFKCDTSVTKGLKSPGNYDFTDAYSNYEPWYVSQNSIKYKNPNQNDILELPIYSEIVSDSQVLKKFFPKIYYKIRFGIIPDSSELLWARSRDKIKNTRYPTANRQYKVNEKRTLKWYSKALLSKSATQLDYDYLPASIFVKMLERIIHNKTIRNNYSKDYLPIIASGHTKDMHNCDNLEKILQLIKNKLPEHVEFWTISQALNYWINE